VTSLHWINSVHIIRGWY